MDVEKLVKAIAQEVLRQMGEGERKEPTFIIGEKSCPKCQKAVKHLGKGAEVIFPDAAPEAHETLRRIVPYLSIRHMSELAAGRADGPFMELTLAALLAGQRVEVMEFEYKRYSETASEGLMRLFEEQEAKLASFGLASMDLNRRETVRIRKPLVTDADVSEAEARGARELLLPEGTQVTPLAVERARDLGMTITRG